MSTETAPATETTGTARLPIATARQAGRAASHTLRNYRGRLAVVAVAACLSAVTGLVAPWVLGRLVDLFLAGPAGGRELFTPVLWVAAAVAAAALAGGLLSWIGMRNLGVATESAVADLREQAMDRALALDAAEVERTGTGDLVSRVAEDSREIAVATTQLIPMMIFALVGVGVSAVGMLALDWRLGLVGLVAVPMYWLSLRWYLPRSGPYYAAERAAFGDRAGHLLGGITGARTLRAYGAGAEELARIDASSARARDLSIDVFRLLTRLFGRNNRAEAVVMGLILGIGFLLVIGGWVSAGEVTTAALLFHRLFNPLGGLVTAFDQVQSAGASLKRIVGIIDLPRPERTAAFAAETQDLIVDRVGHRYLDDPELPPVLSGIDLRVRPGELVAIVGSTGAGKTTLAQVIAGVLTPSSGSCRLGGVELRSVPEDDLRGRVCLVTQEVHTFAGSLQEDLTMAREDVTTDDLWHALRRVRAEGWVAALPDGLQTRVGAGGHRLTVVQAQQIALARVLIADPEVVVLDEATAEAGSSGARELDAAAAAVLADRAGVIVAHRLSQARLADTIVVLEHGRILEQGTHQELVDLGGRYAQLWAAWTGRRA